MESDPVSRLTAEFAKMPGIGWKTAERLSYHVLVCSDEEALALAEAIRDVKERVRRCSRCFNLSGEDPCPLCGDEERDHGVICVVEQPKDVIAFEKTGRYRGLYHVLMGRLAPLEGRSEDQLTLDGLLRRVRSGGVREVILATNPDLEGDGTALWIAEKLRGLGIKVTRIARGVPSGSQIEYASSAMLTDALSGRVELEGQGERSSATESPGG